MERRCAADRRQQDLGPPAGVIERRMVMARRVLELGPPRQDTEALGAPNVRELRQTGTNAQS